jgi:hypothetical protein
MQSARARVLIAALLAGQIATAASRTPFSPPRPPETLGTAQQPLIIKTIPNAEELRRDSEYRANRAADFAAANRAEEKQARNDIVSDVIGVATVIILIVQAIAFFRQTRAMNESVVEMEKATVVAREAAELAKTSADAAVAANKLNRDALLADQRPWVAITAEPRVDFHRSGPHWQLAITLPIQNTGRTPAHNVRLMGQLLSLSERSNVERLHLAFCAEARRGSVGSTAQICFPGRPLNVVGEIQIDADFRRSPLPDFFVLAGCVYYNGFPQDEKTLHATTLLYSIHVRQSDAKAAWVNPHTVSIAYDRFGVTTLPYGWIAD